jgi:hypothetical protein
MGGGEEGQEGVQPNSAKMWGKLLTGGPMYIGVDVLVICCSNSCNNPENLYWFSPILLYWGMYYWWAIEDTLIVGPRYTTTNYSIN